MKTQWVWVVTSCGRSGGLDHVSVWVDESEAMEHARGLRRSGGVRSWRAIDDAGTCRLWLPDNTDGSDRRSVSASFVVSDAGGGAVTKVWEVKP